MAGTGAGVRFAVSEDDDSFARAVMGGEQCIDGGCYFILVPVPEQQDGQFARLVIAGGSFRAGRRTGGFLFSAQMAGELR